MRVLMTALALQVIVFAAFVPTATADLTPMETLGKQLFFDTSLSTPPGVACASCHGPSVGFTGPVPEINETTVVYPGAVHVRFGNRKPPAAAYALSPVFHFDETESLWVGGQFWDGRAATLADQAKGPFLNPLEQNNPNKRSVILKVQYGPYADLFREVFGPDAFADVEQAYDRVADAIAAYERSDEVNPFTSKYDYYLAGMVELSAQEMTGLELFEREDKGNCAACHPSQPGPMGEPPLFTDFTYDNLGTPANPDNPFYGMPPYWNPEGADYVDWGLGGFLMTSGYPAEVYEPELGKVKVPTLRNVARAPEEGFVKAYLHNGVFKDLHTVVDFYNTRDVAMWPPPEVPINVNHEELGDLGLTPEEVDAIVAFLGTLSDGYVPADSPGAPTGSYAAASQTDAASLGVDLRQNHPNPFRPTTTISYRIREAGPVSLVVYDVSGRLVDTLVDVEQAAGSYQVRWNGMNAAGQPVGAGIYFYRLRSGTETATRQMMLLR